ncbi:MAG: hypothetical protein ACPG4T_07925, partial [Nannocystaceae bacterium]
MSRGRFRLDRERALDKLARFTLATPEFYVLELVAAGVRCGASPLNIRCDSNDFVIAWEGGLQPTPTELTNLLDWLFNRGSSDRARMLQHLAQGIHGARGLSPQWIRVSLPATQATTREQPRVREQSSGGDADESVAASVSHAGALLDLTDLRGAAKPLEAPKSSSETTRFEVHIRRPLGRSVVQAFFRTTVRKQLPAEVQAILSHAHGIALDIDDHDRDALAEYAAEAVAVAPSRTLTSRGEGHELWVNFGSHPRANNHVVLLRDGIRVASIEVKTSDIFLCGQIRCDELTLDASRAQVVEDASFRALRARLYTELGQLIHRRLRNLSAHHRLRPRLQRGLLILLYDHHEAARGLHHVPALSDASGRRWSLAQLARSGRVLSFRPDSLAHPDIAEPHFVAREALPGWVADDPMSPEVLQWRLLERHFTNVIHEASAELESRAIGRIRRTYRTSVLRALHASVPGNLYKHNFERATPERQPTTAPQAPLAPESRSQPNAQTGADGITRGVVFLIDGETIPRTCMRVELHVDGLPCETVDLEYPGPLYARISSPDLRAHDDFARVIHDQAYEAALDLARQQADTMAVAIAQTLDAVGLDPDHAERRLLAFICNWLQHQQPPEGLRSAAKINAWLPAPIVSLRLFAHLVSSSSAGSRPEVEAVSVKELLPKLWGEASQSSVCCVAQKIGTELVKPGTIVGPTDRLRLLAHVLGPRVREITQHVLDDRLATRRRASAWATPMLTAPVFGRVKFRAPGLYGELALALEDDEHNDALVAIIHAGVELGSFELPLGVPGCLGSVVWERAVPNRAWNGMQHHEVACATIATELAPHLPELLNAGLAKLRPKPFTELPRWVVGLVQRTQARPEKLLAFELWTALDGQTFSTQSLVDTIELSANACLWTFSARPVPEQRSRWSASTRLLAILLEGNGQLKEADTSPNLGAAAALVEHRASLLAAFTRHLKNVCPEKQIVAWPLPVWA